MNSFANQWANPEVDAAAAIAPSSPAFGTESSTPEGREAQMRHAQKMEAIGTLAGGIAHDFNNILGAIICNAELALEDAASGRNPQNCLAEILKASSRAAELVRQILAFSSRKEQPRRATLLDLPVREAISLLRAGLPSTVTVIANLKSDVPPAMADATQVHQIVMNLCTNAWHALKGGGVIEVGLDFVTVDEHFAQSDAGFRPGPYVHLSIKDSGHGMPPEILARIFEPYFTTKKPGTGTGLGLSVVRDIVRAHSGAITVSSRLGYGSIFHLYFPVAPSELLPLPTALKPITRGTGQRVLFVDDERILCNVARRLLHDLGYVPTICADPAEALDEVRRDPGQFDAVITDLSMPGMTGLELTEAMLQLRPDLPVILATGFAGDITPESARAAGLRDLIAKPTSTRAIADVLQRAFAPST